MEEEIIEEGKNPIWVVIGIVLVFLIVLMIVPISGIKMDPSPSSVPSLESVVPETFPYNNRTVSSRSDYKLLMNPSEVKMIADKIVTKSCSDYSKVCYAKALYYFVRDEFSYVNDPSSFEYVKSPSLSLVSAGGDCDDASVLLANLLEAVGVETRFVFVPGHVYVQGNLPDALAKYKSDGNWVNMDSTCVNCEFGEIPYSNIEKEKQYLG